LYNSKRVSLLLKSPLITENKRDHHNEYDFRNEEGESALEKAEVYLDSWIMVVNRRRSTRVKMRNEIALWRQKIYLAIAKYYKHFSYSHSEITRLNLHES
jgi:hypothetical protein